ncbi:TraR/DksA C4-type zinc finger protein [Streptomyces radiopugnans]|uniref:TraR/DksA family transcriptional regulator n=1 Tax=Streptomyces radiopugnans TaxID=403935 RepID=UPI000B80C636
MVARESAARRARAAREPAGEKDAGSSASAGNPGGPEDAEEPASAGSAGKKPSGGKSAAKRAAASTGAGKAADGKTGAETVVAKKSTTGARAAGHAAPVPPARTAAATAAPDELAVRPGEEPWTAQEVEEARAELSSESERLRVEIHAAEEALNGLMRDSADGAGDDQADTGTKNITREHEMALAENAREMLYQTERALDRLEAGTYGVCENCGKPIGKARMQAFPRATLCVECKQRQERR